MSDPPTRVPETPPEPAWTSKINPALSKIIRQGFLACANSVRADISAANRDRFIKATDELAALKQFTHYDCIKPRERNKLEFLAFSKSGDAFKMIRIASWRAYCYVSEKEKTIFWETAIHDDEFMGLSLAIFFRDAADRF